MAREQLRLIETELERRGVTYTAKRSKSGHIKYRLDLGDGRSRMLCCSFSPSDHRSTKNHLALLRRTLREQT